MKRVLIISYHFTNRDLIGSNRIWGLFEYLKDFGWDPTILTVKTDQEYHNKINNVIQTDQRIFHTSIFRFLNINPKKPLKEQIVFTSKKNKKGIIEFFSKLYKEIFYYPDSAIGWYDSAIESGNELLSKNKFDVIISSSSPATTHIIASVLKKEHNLPWIADFRDLWTQNAYYDFSPFRKYWEKKLELRIISLANAITIVSEPLAIELKKNYKNIPILTITNGYDPDDVKNTAILSNKFSIVYTGQLYRGKRDPELLFDAIKQLCDNGKLDTRDISIDFYGPYEPWLRTDIEKYGLQNIVTEHGHISRETAIAEQNKAQVLLLLTWNNNSEKGVYTGKLFDYLAAHRPILSMGYPEGGVVKDLLKQTQAGVHVSNVEELKEYLIKAYMEYKKTGAAQYNGIEAEVMKYSHREMARKFAEVLDGLST